MTDRSHWTPLDWASLKYHPSISCSCCSEKVRLALKKPKGEKNE